MLVADLHSMVVVCNKGEMLQSYCRAIKKNLSG